MPKTPSPLPPPQRIITGHDSAGNSIIVESTLRDVKYTAPEGSNSRMDNLYLTTRSLPVEISAGVDLAAYRSAPMKLVEPNGSRFHMVDFAPGTGADMHRTESVDYIIIVKGTVELSLDSGEKRVLTVGDVVVQRGTMHAWKNVGKGWSRMMCVLLSAKPVMLEDGRTVAQDLKGIGGAPVKAERASKL